MSQPKTLTPSPLDVSAEAAVAAPKPLPLEPTANLVDGPKQKRRNRKMHTLAHLLSRTIVSSCGCMEWQGGLSANGYSNIKHGNKNWTGHRLVAFLATGVLGEVAMHSCDNRKCLNPSHIKWASQKDNLRDMTFKNRCPKAVLKSDQIIEIRTAYAAGCTQKELSNRFGVSQSNISAIVLGKAWKLASGQLKKPIKRANRVGNNKPFLRYNAERAKFNLPPIGNP